MGKSTQPVDGKQLIYEMKNAVKQNKKETNMQNTTFKVVALTVLITLVVLSALAGMFYLGTQYERGINDRVNAEAKTIVSMTTSEPKLK